MFWCRARLRIPMLLCVGLSCLKKLCKLKSISFPARSWTAQILGWRPSFSKAAYLPSRIHLATSINLYHVPSKIDLGKIERCADQCCLRVASSQCYNTNLQLPWTRICLDCNTIKLETATSKMVKRPKRGSRNFCLQPGAKTP